jgi:GGDEF domain-containing protein
MGVSPAGHDVRIERPWSLGNRSGGLLLALLVPAILVLDYSGGRDFSLRLFYLVPTGLAAWSFGARAGYAVGLVAAAYWAFVGFAIRQPSSPFGSLAWDVMTTSGLFLFVAFIVGRHRAFVDELIDSARLDAASGALSKRELARVLETEVRRSRRYARPLGLAVLDAASAKEFARKGAEFLPAVVRAIQGHVRDSDCVGRIEERRLAVVFVECSAEEALVAARRLREMLPATVKLGSGMPAVGLVTYGGASIASASELVQLAAAELETAQRGAGLSQHPVP